MPTVRAKFRLDRVEISMHAQGHWEGASTWVDDGKVEKRSLVFRPVHSNNPDDENHLFWEATPNGEIRLDVVNPEAWQHFQIDQEYYIDFTPAGAS